MTKSRSIAAPQITSSGPQSLTRPCASTSRFSRRYAARKTISAIFPSSPGWIWKGPACTHRRAPFTVSPIPGRSGMKSSATAPRPNRYL